MGSAINFPGGIVSSMIEGERQRVHPCIIRREPENGPSHIITPCRSQLKHIKPSLRPCPRCHRQQLPEVTHAGLQEGQEMGTCLPRHGNLHPPAGRAAPKTTHFKSWKEEPQDGNLQFSCRTWAVREGCRRKSCHFGDSFSRTRYHYPVSTSDRNRRRLLSRHK